MRLPLYENGGCSEALGCHPFLSGVLHGKQDICYLHYPTNKAAKIILKYNYYRALIHFV